MKTSFLFPIYFFIEVNSDDHAAKSGYSVRHQESIEPVDRLENNRSENTEKRPDSVAVK